MYKQAWNIINVKLYKQTCVVMMLINNNISYSLSLS